jgi:plasmid stabilization system protein ParE
VIKKIKWTNRAESDFDNTLEYLDKTWGESVKREFYTQTMNVLALIAQTPLMYQLYDKKRKIHRCVLTKQIYLYYRILESEVHLLTFWDNRQEPKKLQL